MGSDWPLESWIEDHPLRSSQSRARVPETEAGNSEHLNFPSWKVSEPETAPVSVAPVALGDKVAPGVRVAVATFCLKSLETVVAVAAGKTTLPSWLTYSVTTTTSLLSLGCWSLCSFCWWMLFGTAVVTRDNNRVAVEESKMLDSFIEKRERIKVS